VINARIDVVYLYDGGGRDDKVDDTIARALSYLEAGADCVYPLLIGDIETLTRLIEEIRAPINVYVDKSTAPMRELEAAGISRLSVGPWVLKACLTRFKEIAVAMKNYESFDVLLDGTITSDEMRRYVR
jgi:2-methylisocitrate lyase-like PEP mutase family enzyme